MKTFIWTNEPIHLHVHVSSPTVSLSLGQCISPNEKNALTQQKFSPNYRLSPFKLSSKKAFLLYLSVHISFYPPAKQIAFLEKKKWRKILHMWNLVYYATLLWFQKAHTRT